MKRHNSKAEETPSKCTGKSYAGDTIPHKKAKLARQFCYVCYDFEEKFNGMCMKQLYTNIPMQDWVMHQMAKIKIRVLDIPSKTDLNI